MVLHPLLHLKIIKMLLKEFRVGLTSTDIALTLPDFQIYQRKKYMLSKLYRGGCSLCGQVRYASREEKRQARTEEVIQFKAPGTQPAERVYVWGHARTGAL
ncbi:hypothetical protein MAR_030603, partial [Mya arenaria]